MIKLRRTKIKMFPRIVRDHTIKYICILLTCPSITSHSVAGNLKVPETGNHVALARRPHWVTIWVYSYQAIWGWLNPLSVVRRWAQCV